MAYYPPRIPLTLLSPCLYKGCAIPFCMQDTPSKSNTNRTGRQGQHSVQPYQRDGDSTSSNISVRKEWVAISPAHGTWTVKMYKVRFYYLCNGPINVI